MSYSSKSASSGSMSIAMAAPRPSNHAMKQAFRPNLPPTNVIQHRRMSAAALMDDMFNFEYEFDDLGDSSDPGEESELHHSAYTNDEPFQLSLDLENLDDVRANLKYSIGKFNRAYERLAFYAVNWFYLMEEVDSDPHIAKMVRDLQMYRKLSGGGNPVRE